MAKSFRTQFGDRLKARRLSCGFKSLGELAKKIGVKGQTIKNYEDGSTLPDAEILSRLAESLNCTVDYLTLSENAPTHEAASVVQQTGLSAEAVKVLQKLSSDDQYDVEKTMLGDSLIAGIRLDFISRLICHMDKSGLAESFTEWSQAVSRIKAYESIDDTEKVLKLQNKHPEDKHLGSIEKGLRYDITKEMETVLDSIRQSKGSSKRKKRATNKQAKGEENNGKGEE